MIAPTLTRLRRLVRHDSALSFGARALFEDVCELSQRDGFCCAENAHFADAFGVSDRAVRGWISDLIDAGYLRRTLGGGTRRLVPIVGLSEPETDKRNETSAPRKNGSVPRKESSETPKTERERGGSSVPVPSINNPPEGDKSARTREGSDSDSSSAGPAIEEVLTRAAMSGVPADRATEFFWFYEAQDWVTSGAHPQPITNWVAKLMQWNLSQSRYTRSGGKPEPAKMGTTRNLAELI